MQGEALDSICARFVAKDGSTILVEGNSSCRFENGRPTATRGVFHNVTERAVAQQELAEYAARLEKSNSDLQQFAYTASHDLKEPLRAVSGFCQLLARKYRGQLDEAGAEYVDHIVDGARRMQALLNGLLAYSRVQTAGKAFRQVDCNEVVAEALANLRVRIEENGAQIDCESLPCIRADAAQLVQLFQNLVGNAIKYRGERRPQIRIWAEAKDDEWVFAVRDNGIGIDDRQADRIFVIFQRLHARDEYPGTGMGLAICKRIAERHHGRIWVHSEPGRGSTFYFSIPISLLKTDEEEDETGANLPKR
jgi:light-regulated signal transduction histidine kinase (bacteriophytochrome)